MQSILRPQPFAPAFEGEGSFPEGRSSAPAIGQATEPAAVPGAVGVKEHCRQATSGQDGLDGTALAQGHGPAEAVAQLGPRVDPQAVIDRRPGTVHARSRRVATSGINDTLCPRLAGRNTERGPQRQKASLLHVPLPCSGGRARGEAPASRPACADPLRSAVSNSSRLSRPRQSSCEHTPARSIRLTRSRGRYSRNSKTVPDSA
jgi:hypothetical protein